MEIEDPQLKKLCSFLSEKEETVFVYSSSHLPKDPSFTSDFEWEEWSLAFQKITNAFQDLRTRILCCSTCFPENQ
jgi:hypothetical protein